MHIKRIHDMVEKLTKCTEMELEKGIGNISVDGDNISGNSNIGNGTNEVEIHGGIGAINVKFKDK